MADPQQKRLTSEEIYLKYENKKRTVGVSPREEFDEMARRVYVADIWYCVIQKNNEPLPYHMKTETCWCVIL